jgi:uncharacterized repeat protein (TIGR03806 family)
MIQKHCIWLYFGFLFIFLCSCSSEDDYTALPIETSPESVSGIINTPLQIFIFANDVNIPSNGYLALSNPSNGSVLVSDLNGTPQNLSDDIVVYTPNPNYVGMDSFQYTICPNGNSSLCKTEIVTITITSNSQVIFNLNDVPYPTLSEYHFFEGNLKDLNPTSGVLPYDLNSPLFSDYAHKKRFVWMPFNVAANYINDYTPLDFPIGTVLIKNFYYDNILPNNTTRIIETRLMFKKEDGWNFAKYVWNDEQTEAIFTNQGSFVNLSWLESGQTKTTNYRIPSQAECFTCHNKFGTPLPIGPKPQNLNKNYTYNTETTNQLNKWVAIGYLENNLPPSIVSTVNWEDESLPLNLRVRSYLDINCAHCHSEESYCEYRPMRFAFNENDDDTNIGICVTPDTQVDPYTKIIVPNNIGLSLLHFRISTTQEQYRMPLLGRSIKHDEGVRLIEEWINSLTNQCN